MRVVVSALTLLLFACGREPSFDERLSESQNQIEARALELDEQLNDANPGTSSEVQPKVER